MSQVTNTDIRPTTTVKLGELAQTAQAIRLALAQMVIHNGYGYLQQGLGAADIFTALFFSELRLDPQRPDWPQRDRFLLSTAHNSAVFYATLAQRGLIDKSLLDGYCADGSALEINVSERLPIYVEATCGSLGQGLSVGLGLARSAKRHNNPSRCYVLLGDGELQEGQVWEAALYAPSCQLDNLCLIVDLNDMQVEGATTEVVTVTDISNKWQAFGWHVLEIDGNDIKACLTAFEKARQYPGKPTVILARTLVGKGVPFLEGQKSHTVRLREQAAEDILRVLGKNL